MAKITATKRIVKEDFSSEDQELVDTLAFPINSGFENITSALNKGLTFDDNFNAQLKEITVTVDGSGTPTTTTSFKTTLRSNAYGVMCIRALAADNSYVTAAPFVSYVEGSSSITIRNITGLTAGIKYTLRLLVIGL